jgi:hypothetical protein
MRRVLLFCSGILLAVLAEAILGISHDLYARDDTWLSPEFTRIVGVAAIVQGVVAALGAGLCLGRAFGPLTSAPIQSGTAVSGPAPAALGGGPVLPICGILFLLATVGPYLIGQSESHMVELMASLPPDGNYSSEVVDYHRQRARTAQTFAVLWLVVGGALLATPLFLKSRIWHMGWRINGAGCGIALGGFLLSGMGVLVWFANGLAMEGARMEPSLVGHLGVLAGAIVAVVGSIIAASGSSRTGNATS